MPGMMQMSQLLKGLKTGGPVLGCIWCNQTSHYRSGTDPLMLLDVDQNKPHQRAVKLWLKVTARAG